MSMEDDLLAIDSQIQVLRGQLNALQEQRDEIYFRFKLENKLINDRTKIADYEKIVQDVKNMEAR